MTPLDIFLLVFSGLAALIALNLIITVVRRGQTPETKSLARFTIGVSIALLVGAGAITYGVLSA